MNELENNQQYISQKGFIKIDVIRGFSEIAFLYRIIKETVKNNGFICGGYVRYMCSPLVNPIPAGDVDIYSKTQDDFDKLKDVLMNKFNLEIKHENDVSITFKKSKDENLKYCPPLQLIKPIEEGNITAKGDMKTILENFDFTVIRIGLINTQKALADADFIHDESHKLLRLKNIHCPISSTLRCMKYSRKGYFLRPIQAFRLFADWDQRTDEYRSRIAELIEQTETNNLTQEEIDELEALMRID